MTDKIHPGTLCNHDWVQYNTSSLEGLVYHDNGRKYGDNDCPETCQEDEHMKQIAGDIFYCSKDPEHMRVLTHLRDKATVFIR